jgi:hypothetical protein
MNRLVAARSGIGLRCNVSVIRVGTGVQGWWYLSGRYSDVKGESTEEDVSRGVVSGG